MTDFTSCVPRWKRLRNIQLLLESLDGGLAGQILEKIDGTNYNWQWVNNTASLALPNSWQFVAGYASNGLRLEAQTNHAGVFEVQRDQTADNNTERSVLALYRDTNGSGAGADGIGTFLSNFTRDSAAAMTYIGGLGFICDDVTAGTIDSHAGVALVRNSTSEYVTEFHPASQRWFYAGAESVRLNTQTNVLDMDVAGFGGSLTNVQSITDPGGGGGSIQFVDFDLGGGVAFQFRQNLDMNLNDVTDIGTAEADFFQIGGDANTYMAQSSGGADSIGFFTGGSERALINSAGNLDMLGNDLLNVGGTIDIETNGAGGLQFDDGTTVVLNIQGGTQPNENTRLYTLDNSTARNAINLYRETSGGGAGANGIGTGINWLTRNGAGDFHQIAQLSAAFYDVTATQEDSELELFLYDNGTARQSFNFNHDALTFWTGTIKRFEITNQGISIDPDDVLGGGSIVGVSNISDAGSGNPAINFVDFDIGGGVEFDFRQSLDMNANDISNVGILEADEYRFGGDPDTYFDNPSANTVRLVTGGSVGLECGASSLIINSRDLVVGGDDLFVDISTNFVGIGTLAPARKLHIANTSEPGVLFEDTDAAANFGKWQTYLNGSGSYIIRALNDAISAGYAAYQIDRSAASIDAHFFNIGSNQPAVEISGDGLQVNAASGAMNNEDLGVYAYRVKSGDTPRSSTTAFSNDPHLSVVLSANATYVVEMLLIAAQGVAGASGGGLRFRLVGPAGSTIMTWAMGQDSSNATLDTLFHGAGYLDDSSTGFVPGAINATVNGDPIFMPASQFWAAGRFMLIRAFARVAITGTSGTMAMQWAQNTSDADATTLYGGSMMKVYKAP